MRRTLVSCRGAKGYNWFTKFQEQGVDGFRKFKPPTAFDWNKPIDPASGVEIRPRVYFDMSVEKEKMGRIEFELAADVVPRTVENFMLLVMGKAAKVKGYQGSTIHVVSKNNVIMGGDVEVGDGTGNHSAHKTRYIEDENYIIPHAEKGLLSMVSVGINTGGSQFYIGLGSGAGNRHLNGRCVVFGRVVKGMEVVDEIGGMFTSRLKPAREVVVDECGVING